MLFTIYGHGSHLGNLTRYQEQSPKDTPCCLALIGPAALETFEKQWPYTRIWPPRADNLLGQINHIINKPLVKLVICCRFFL